VRTASVAQVRQPLYTRSVARWKHYDKALRPLFDAPGPVQHAPPPAPAGPADERTPACAG
jgi:hypothetical protein